MANFKAPATPADISGSASKMGASVLVISIGVGSEQMKNVKFDHKEHVSKLMT